MNIHNAGTEIDCADFSAVGEIITVRRRLTGEDSPECSPLAEHRSDLMTMKQRVAVANRCRPRIAWWMPATAGVPA